jgi:hypothetical protein
MRLGKKIRLPVRQSSLQLSDVLFFYSFFKSPKKNIVLLVTLEYTIHTGNTSKLYTYRFPIRYGMVLLLLV